MVVKLVSVTKPLIEGIDNAEEFISYVARVSNPANQGNKETAEKLLGYLIRNKHLSPFELVNLTIEIKTTRDIGRQILRHRSFVFQEFSQRYAKPDPLDFYVDREARLQDPKNRQNSIEVADGSKLSISENFAALQKQVLNTSLDAYNWALLNGIAKEQARVFLPEGLTPTHMYMSGNLRSWITYITLREKNGTQKEHKLIALECKKIVAEQFPTVAKALGGEGDWSI